MKEHIRTIEVAFGSYDESNMSWDTAKNQVPTLISDVIRLSFTKMEASMKKSWKKDIITNFKSLGISVFKDVVIRSKKYKYVISFENFFNCNFSSMTRTKGE